MHRPLITSHNYSKLMRVVFHNLSERFSNKKKLSEEAVALHNLPHVWRSATENLSFLSGRRYK